MSNYNIQNLVQTQTPVVKTKAIKIGQLVFPIAVGGGNADMVLGVVDADGKFQALSFQNNTVTNSGQPVTVQSYKTWNSTLPTPNVSAGKSMSELDMFDWMTILG